MLWTHLFVIIGIALTGFFTLLILQTLIPINPIPIDAPTPITTYAKPVLSILPIIQNTGNLRIVYNTPKTANYEPLYNILSQSGFYDNLVEQINSYIALPTDVPIIFTECERTDAYYNYSAGIVICYEIIQTNANLAATSFATQKEINLAITDSISMILFHEIGHALIDLLNLPVTGKEEDAADQIATIMILKTKDGDRAALNGAILYLLWSKDPVFNTIEFWSTHSLNLQRFYNILCWIYGYEPITWSYLRENGYLPESRASGCIQEYTKMHERWEQLLSPHYI